MLISTGISKKLLVLGAKGSKIKKDNLLSETVQQMKPSFHPRFELKAKRLSKELTSGRLSCMTGVSRTSIERFESGTRDFSSNSFMKVLYALGFCIIPLDEYNQLKAQSKNLPVEREPGDLKSSKVSAQKRPTHKLDEFI